MHANLSSKILAVVAGGAAFSSLSALAYTLGAAAWPQRSATYFINPANADAPEAAIAAAVQAGADVWAGQSQASVTLSNGGRTTAAALANDGKNNVFFRNTVSPDGPNVIASTYCWWNGSTFLDCDIAFWDGYAAFFTGDSGCGGVSNAAYVEDIAAHEFGHFAGLLHSNVGAATMYGGYSYCSQAQRTLDPDDVAGIEARYPPADSSSVPTAPTGLSAARSAAAPTSALDLAWMATSSDHDGFKIERSSGGSFAVIAQVGAGAASYTDGALPSDTSFTYRVAAFNTSGSSSFSNTASAATAAVSGPPGLPSSPLPADGAGAIAVKTTLDWANALNAQTYDLYLGTSPTPPLYAPNLTASSKRVSLAAGVTYYWYVEANNALGSVTGPTWRFTTRAKQGGH